MCTPPHSSHKKAREIERERHGQRFFFPEKVFTARNASCFICPASIAQYLIFDNAINQSMRRQKVFRDRSDPFDYYNDFELYERSSVLPARVFSWSLISFKLIWFGPQSKTVHWPQFSKFAFVCRYTLLLPDIICSLSEDIMNSWTAIWNRIWHNRNCQIKKGYVQYLATGNFMITNGEILGVSKVTAHYAIHRVVTALIQHSSEFVAFQR